MAKNKVQDWDVVPSNNSDVGGINISEGMPPSNVNDSIRMIMAQVKAWQSGGDSADWTTNGEATFNSNVNVNSTLTVGNGTGTNGQFLKSLGASQPPVWETLKSMAQQDSDNVSITGGTITGITNFTTSSGDVTATNLTANNTLKTNSVLALGNNWTVTYTSGNLIFSHDSVAKMKLDSNGNLTVTGNVTAYGTI